MKREHYQVILLIFIEDNSFLYKKKSLALSFLIYWHRKGVISRANLLKRLGKTLHNHMIKVMKDDNFLVRMFLEASIE